MSGLKPPCAACGHIHTGTMAYAVHRFTPNKKYQANYEGAPLRGTRGEAVTDKCRQLKERSTP